MRSSFIGLEASKRSIQIAQKSLDITNSNLSNVTTSGYTRQRVDTASLSIASYSNSMTNTAKLSLSGQGVTATGVAQIRDPYIDKRYRDTTCYVAEYETKCDLLTEVETTLDNIDNTGLTSYLDSFKHALQNYASNADTEEYASLVRNEAYNIATLLHTYNTELQSLLDTNVYELQCSVEQVNTLTDKIVEYNKAITGDYAIVAADKIYEDTPVSGSYGPNELIDERNLLLDELSYYGNIHVEENNDGSVKVTMGGVMVVDGEKSNKIFMKDYEDYGAAVLKFTNGDDVKLEAGDLKAYTDIINGNGPYANYYQNSEYGIPYYKSAMNAFAEAFSSLMNKANGMTETDTSRAMFGSSEDVYDANGNCTYRAAITADNIRISNEWMNNATMIGEVYDAAKNTYSLSLDGTSVNNLILSLEKDIQIGRSGDFKGGAYDYVLFISNRLGQSISYTDEQFDVVSATANGLLDSRDAISGVSDTEEGINMMVYQKWYNASSRMMTTLDDCLDKLINGTGRVGL